MNINMILMSLLEKDVIGYSNINIYEYKYILFYVHIFHPYFKKVIKKSSFFTKKLHVSFITIIEYAHHLFSVIYIIKINIMKIFIPYRNHLK